MPDHIVAIRVALQRARELGEQEMDWLGTGSDQGYADRQQRKYLATIQAGQDALAALTAGVGIPFSPSADEPSQ